MKLLLVFTLIATSVAAMTTQCNQNIQMKLINVDFQDEDGNAYEPMYVQFISSWYVFSPSYFGSVPINNDVVKAAWEVGTGDLSVTVPTLAAGTTKFRMRLSDRADDDGEWISDLDDRVFHYSCPDATTTNNGGNNDAPSGQAVNAPLQADCEQVRTRAQNYLDNGAWQQYIANHPDAATCTNLDTDMCTCKPIFDLILQQDLDFVLSGQCTNPDLNGLRGGLENKQTEWNNKPCGSLQQECGKGGFCATSSVCNDNAETGFAETSATGSAGACPSGQVCCEPQCRYLSVGLRNKGMATAPGLAKTITNPSFIDAAGKAVSDPDDPHRYCLSFAKYGNKLAKRADVDSSVTHCCMAPACSSNPKVKPEEGYRNKVADGVCAIQSVCSAFGGTHVSGLGNCPGPAEPTCCVVEMGNAAAVRDHQFSLETANPALGQTGTIATGFRGAGSTLESSASFNAVSAIAALLVAAAHL